MWLQKRKGKSKHAEYRKKFRTSSKLSKLVLKQVPKLDEFFFKKLKTLKISSAILIFFVKRYQIEKIYKKTNAKKKRKTEAESIVLRAETRIFQNEEANLLIVRKINVFR